MIKLYPRAPNDRPQPASQWVNLFSPQERRDIIQALDEMYERGLYFSFDESEIGIARVLAGKWPTAATCLGLRRSECPVGYQEALFGGDNIPIGWLSFSPPNGWESKGTKSTIKL